MDFRGRQPEDNPFILFQIYTPGLGTAWTLVTPVWANPVGGAVLDVAEYLRCVEKTSQRSQRENRERF